MMNISVFLFQDYREFIGAYQNSLASKGHGFQSRVATALGCQNAYVSRVFRGLADFSLEQAQALAREISLSADEESYFLLLVLKARAGTVELREIFLKQIVAVQEKKNSVTGRMEAVLPNYNEIQARYYSNYIYSALHVLASVPGGDRAVWARGLGVSERKVSEALEFLEESGILRMDGGRYIAGKTRMHLPKDSPLLPQYHYNWRLQAMQSLGGEGAGELHYTSVVSLSKKDFTELQQMMLAMIEKYNAVIKDSADEDAACLVMDWFRL